METFDDILKSKLSEREFPFDEENWEEAEAMISSFRRKEKIKKGAFIFLAGLALGIVIMLPFIINVNKTNQALIVKTDESSANKVFMEERAQADNEHSSVSTDVKQIETDKQNDAGSILSDKFVQVDNKEGRSVKKINETAEKQKLSMNENTSVIKEEKSKEGKRKRDSKKLIAAELKQKKNYVKSETSSGLIAQSEAKSQTTSTSEIIDKKPESIIISEEKMIDSTIGTKASIINLDSSKTALILTKDSILKDSIAKSIAEKPKENPAFDKICRVSISVGGNYLIAGSLNPIQGVELMKPLTLNWMMGTGIYYTYINIKHNNAVKTIVTSTTYDFGYTSDVVQIKTNDLHYIVVPVFVQRAINEKNNVVIGVNNYMLLTVSNNYSTYKESYGNKQNVSSAKTFGYSNGFNPYDIALLLGYRRILFNNLSVGLYMNYGLMNINKKDYYKENVFDRNVSAQMLLTYRLR